MEQRLTVISIGADDLDKMRKFYEEVFEWKPAAANKDIVFYQMNGFLFSICRKKDLAMLSGVPPDGQGFRAASYSYNVSSEDEVRALYQQLLDKGVKMRTEPTAPPFGGLYFYFEDVEGNILEIACNDYIPLDKNNSAIGHKPIGHL